MKILNILSSINGKNSHSNKLVSAINTRISSEFTDVEILVRDLSENPLPHLDASHFVAFGLPSEARTPEAEAAVFHSDTAISEIRQADIIVIAVPFYNFNIPGTLKSWIDHIVRSGATFTYGENGPKGLLENKKVYLAMASGGIYSTEAMKGLDFAEPYLRFLLGFIGLTDVTTFRVEGTKMQGVGEKSYEKAIERISEHMFATQKL
ncbi:FMN-dependent NADH-azoreductase [Flavobacterium selenitireducens]|uniref:FMN-dependent NADH-azoreductase n=1 Tax=Flavobacterium selenitireducens TaxID=2722704 RepID=UPI00168A785E|nr:NAD(P)H-dependent oxidoreductase [Flavobacterium selenitireducens]MBD3582624.1 FMN-dependent NADH-azoreductase [Flavobacterium selenitireducens]